MTKRKKWTTPFDKYYLYRNSVQSPDADVEFFRDTYKKIRGRVPKTLREDFCGTYSVCCEWVKLNPKNKAYGIDLDDKPISYGTKHYLPRLTPEQQERVSVKQASVLAPRLPKADVICAMNFSYFTLRTREQMLSYFRNVRKTLNPGGIMVIDSVGGTECMVADEESKRCKGFTYFWELEEYDPIQNEAIYYIHFKRDGEPKRRKQFKYHWRLWSLPELREIFADAGFSRTTVYWEGTDRRGRGNGEFKPSEHGDESAVWIAYIIAER